MSWLVWLVPIALGMGLVGLAAFLWSMRSGQYDDLDGAAERVLITERADAPLAHKAWVAEQTAGGSSGPGNSTTDSGVRPASEERDQEREANL